MEESSTNSSESGLSAILPPEKQNQKQLLKSAFTECKKNKLCHLIKNNTMNGKGLEKSYIFFFFCAN